MQEVFPGRKTRIDLFRWWWDVGSRSDRAAGLANPILNLTQTSGRSLMPRNARHGLLGQLAGKPDAKGKFFEPRDTVLKSDYVIANFPKVFRTSIHDCSRLSGKQLTQRGLCA